MHRIHINAFLVIVKLLDAQFASSAFSCIGKISGYYADLDTGCQVYHMCDGIGRQFSYTCPNATLFQQRMLICDHWYMVNCSKSENDYGANALIGQVDKPFVDDSVMQLYHRTPRTDLSTDLSDKQFEKIFKKNREQLKTTANLVGIDFSGNSSQGIGDDTSANYTVPSRWLTNFITKYATDNSNLKSETFTTEKPMRYNNNDVIYSNSTERKTIFKSNYKATTPIYPTLSELPMLQSDVDIGLLPPLKFKGKSNLFLTNSYSGSKSINNEASRNISKQKSVKANSLHPETFQFSNSLPNNNVDSSSLQSENNLKTTPGTETITNGFPSLFNTTTSIHSTAKELEPSSQDAGLLPPLDINNILNSFAENMSSSLDIKQLNDEQSNSGKKYNSHATVAMKPSRVYQPPKFKPDYTQLNNSEEITNNSYRVKILEASKLLNTDRLRNLRKALLIPDYEFPLEFVSRPSYESKLNSFQV